MVSREGTRDLVCFSHPASWPRRGGNLEFCRGFVLHCFCVISARSTARTSRSLLVSLFISYPFPSFTKLTFLLSILTVPLGVY